MTLFKDIFQEVYELTYKASSKAQESTMNTSLSTTWSRRLSNLRWFRLRDQNYDGDVQSNTLAQGSGSLGMMTSELITPDGGIIEVEAAHGNLFCIYRLSVLTLIN